MKRPSLIDHDNVWPFLVNELWPYVENLEAENIRLRANIESWCAEVRELRDERGRLQDLLLRVLGWRGLDGDGISDPLRQEIRLALRLEEEP